MRIMRFMERIRPTSQREIRPTSLQYMGRVTYSMESPIKQSATTRETAITGFRSLFILLLGCPLQVKQFEQLNITFKITRVFGHRN